MLYKAVGREYSDHQSLLHGNREYSRGEFTTNSVEGYFSIFKRGMRGVYQHCSEHYLHRYLCEFDFRYTNRVAFGVNDGDRAQKALEGTVGKRLMLKNLRPTQPLKRPGKAPRDQRWRSRT